MAGTFLKIVSYIYDFPLEKRQSHFSGMVEVSMHRGQFKLSTQNAIYSFGKNYTSFSVAFKALDILNNDIRNVLVLGFGLGSVIDLLEDHPAIESITAVESDEIIIELARKYLFSSLKSKVNIILEDAGQFISTSEKKYDLILFDIFIQDETPLPFIEEMFLKQLKTRVNKDGILLFSKIDVTEKNRIENNQFEKIFTEVFPASFSIDTDGNKVYTWLNKQN